MGYRFSEKKQDPIGDAADVRQPARSRAQRSLLVRKRQEVQEVPCRI
jgi:hypothetical protein